ncbi:unnamed protein product [Bursaphelenchus okinawaensis]|uniref:UDP-glucuronosyltransferase n=1 Tax=Bursaphelenchus okinawaensis TaxID=465554 RepID=A0A811K171_9BILA|nr:unnamed protein product [Bursaphelenchus okinawaensis]CAG9089553.1 unnamed protein product [Bursaphelenchus okinawaensis]
MNLASCIWLFLFVLTCHGANVLVYNGARIAQSHVFFMAKIADVLQEDGHNVTFYQQEVFKSVNKVGVRKAKAVVRKADEDLGGEPNQDVWHPPEGLVANLKMFKAYGNAITKACEFQLNDKEYLAKLKAEKYDIALIEYFDICGFAIVEQLGIPKWITTSAMMIQSDFNSLFGHPKNLAFVPGFDGDHGSRLTYKQRVKAFFSYPLQKIMYYLVFGEGAHGVVRRMGQKFHYEDVIARSSYVFINVDEHLAFQMPLSEKMIYIGGMDQDAVTKPLEKEFSTIYNNAKKGVILVSFGTIAKSVDMPEEKKQDVLSLVRNFPEYEFIWKYEGDDAVGKELKNLHKRKWLPQSDLLAHLKTLAFVTHGGLNSFSEAAHRGMPVVCVPLFADQANNCYSGAEKGLGIVVKKEDFSGKRLIEAVDELLHNSTYKQRSVHFARMMAAKPFKPKDRITGYVNHALEFDVNMALDLPSRHLSFIQLYFIDVIVPLVLLLVLFVYIIVKVSKFLFKFVKKVKVE